MPNKTQPSKGYANFSELRSEPTPRDDFTLLWAAALPLLTELHDERDRALSLRNKAEKARKAEKFKKRGKLLMQADESEVIANELGDKIHEMFRQAGVDPIEYMVEIGAQDGPSDWINIEPPRGTGALLRMLCELANILRRVPDSREDWVGLMHEHLGSERGIEPTDRSGESLIFHGKAITHKTLNKRIDYFKTLLPAGKS